MLPAPTTMSPASSAALIEQRRLLQPACSACAVKSGSNGSAPRPREQAGARDRRRSHRTTTRAPKRRGSVSRKRAGAADQLEVVVPAARRRRRAACNISEPGHAQVPQQATAARAPGQRHPNVLCRARELANFQIVKRARRHTQRPTQRRADVHRLHPCAAQTLGQADSRDLHLGQLGHAGLSTPPLDERPRMPDDLRSSTCRAHGNRRSAVGRSVGCSRHWRWPACLQRRSRRNRMRRAAAAAKTRTRQFIARCAAVLSTADRRDRAQCRDTRARPTKWCSMPRRRTRDEALFRRAVDIALAGACRRAGARRGASLAPGGSRQHRRTALSAADPDRAESSGRSRSSRSRAGFTQTPPEQRSALIAALAAAAAAGDRSQAGRPRCSNSGCAPYSAMSRPRARPSRVAMGRMWLAASESTKALRLAQQARRRRLAAAAGPMLLAIELMPIQPDAEAMVVQYVSQAASRHRRAPVVSYTALTRSQRYAEAAQQLDR